MQNLYCILREYIATTITCLIQRQTGESLRPSAGARQSLEGAHRDLAREHVESFLWRAGYLEWLVAIHPAVQKKRPKTSELAPNDVCLSTGRGGTQDMLIVRGNVGLILVRGTTCAPHKHQNIALLPH